MAQASKVVPITTLQQAVEAIHKKFAEENDSERKAQRCRVACGRMLLTLRERIEAGEAGEVGWWEWYEQKFVRSRKDAEKVMKLASSLDPEGAHEEEKAATRERMTASRARARENKSPEEDDDVEGEDLVDHALRLVEEMDAKQRRRFFAACKEEYAL